MMQYRANGFLPVGSDVKLRMEEGNECHWKNSIIDVKTSLICV